MSNLERHQLPDVEVQRESEGNLQPGACYTQINYYGSPASNQATPAPAPPFPWLLIGGTGLLVFAGVFWWMAPQQQLSRTQAELTRTQVQLSAAQAEVHRIRLCVEGQ